MEFIDLTNNTYGRLTVINKGKTNKWGNIYWNCKCSCGNIKEIQSKHLKSGKTISCGCYRQEVTAKLNDGSRQITHGMSNTPEYDCWISMKQRCNNPNDNNYYRYGGRGIIVCDRWLNSFEDFYEDMGPRLSEDHSIDRLDNDGNYEPDNCMWADYDQQMQNNSRNVIPSMNEANHIREQYATGEFYYREIAEYYGCDPTTIKDIVLNKSWVP